MKLTQPLVRQGLTRRSLVLTVVLMLFGCAQNTSAQYWNASPSPSPNNNIYYNSGNVGIGTASPDTNAKLHVYNAPSVGVDIQSANAGGWARFRLITGTHAYGWFTGDSTQSDAPNKIGLFDYTAGAFRMMIDSAGNVGIGTTSPDKLLTVQGSSNRRTLKLISDGDGVGYSGVDLVALTNTNIPDNRAADFFLSMRKDTWYGGDGSGPSFIIETGSKSGNNFSAPFTITPTNDILLNSGRGVYGMPIGNVGIGTASPMAKLDVQGSIASNRNWFYLASAGDTNHAIGNVSGDGEQFRYWNFLDFYSPNGGGNVRLLNNGKVGIGTTTPNYQLDVQGGSINAASGLCIAGDCKTTWSQVGGSQWNNGSNSSISYNTGNVGIGTTDPHFRLEVNGSIRAADNIESSKAITNGEYVAGNFKNLDTSNNTNKKVSLEFNGADTVGTVKPVARIKALPADANWAGGQLGFFYRRSADETLQEAMRINSSGNVGIGTTGPNYKLEVNGEINATGLRINGTPISTGGGSSQWIGSSTIYYDGGSVGIGNPAPTSGYKLDVTGNIKVSGTGNIDAAGTITGGNIVARYQDVAEWVPAAAQVPAGTVVVLDTTRSNQVISSSQAYDTRVAGVVSAQPGIALGESGANKVLVATTGRVMVKVDASRAPIHIGDLLVTSDVPGVAMKSQPINLGGRKMHMPGTLIGKALEPLEKGSGKILVLLSLQ